MNQLNDMATFASVVAEGNFSRAARNLGLSKATVSKRVSRLEDRLGARLLNRTTRRLSLTEIGSAFHEHCARLVAEAEEAEHTVTELTANPRGTLKVNVPMSFGRLHIARAIPEFLSRFPDLKVDITLDDAFVDLVHGGYDLAIRIADLPDSSLVARRLAPSRRVVCGSPGYFRRRGVPETPDDLRNHDCLSYSYLATTGSWPFRKGQRTWNIPVSGSLNANNGDVLLAAAAAGTGLVLVPTFMVEQQLRSGALRPILASYAESDFGIYAVYPHRRHVSAKVRAFVDYFAERFGPAPYWDEALRKAREPDDG